MTGSGDPACGQNRLSAPQMVRVPQSVFTNETRRGLYYRQQRERRVRRMFCFLGHPHWITPLILVAALKR